MGYKTWEFKIGDKRIAVKALKAEASQVAQALKQAANIHQYKRELSGIIGRTEGSFKEYGYVTFSPFSPLGAPDDPGAYRQELQVILGGLPEVITRDQIGGIISQANACFDAHVPVQDNRKTEEQHEAEQAESRRQEQDRQAKQAGRLAKFLSRFGQDPSTVVTVPEGHMAIVLKVTFDDSDSMSDYFNPHRTIGCSLLLTTCPKGPETQAKARAALERYEDLAALEWSWQTENFSGGHGNYLVSSYTGEEIHVSDSYREQGAAKVPFRYEIQFDKYSGGKDISVYRTYPGKAPAVGSTAAAGPIDGIEVRENEEKNGVEIRFNAKPSSEIRSRLKSHGFRWARRGGCWYKRRTPAVLELAHNLAAEFSA